MIEFKGKAVWVANETGEKYIFVYPVQSLELTTEMAKEICLEKDFVKESDTYNFSFLKISKKGLFELFGLSFDVDYPGALLRFFDRKNNEFKENVLPPDENVVQCVLMKSSKLKKNKKESN